MRKQFTGWDRRVARLIVFGVVLYAAAMNLDSVLASIKNVLRIFTPIIIGCVLALVLDVPMYGFDWLIRKLDRKKKTSEKMRNVVSLVLSIIFLPLVLFILMRFVLPQFISAITNVISIVDANQDQIVAFFARFGIEASFVDKVLDDIIAWVTANFSMITGAALSTILSVFASVTDIVLGVILSIYLLADKVAIKRRTRSLVRAFLPERAAKGLLRCGPMFISTFRIFLSRQCLEAVILGVLLLSCMLIFNIPYAFTIACMTAILALIPYLGAYISMAVGVVLVITVSPVKALIFAVIFLVAQQIEGNVIYPKVVGKSVGLPSYVTLSAVVVGGAIAGIPGMFFIIPVVSVVYVLLREYVNRRNRELDEAAENPEA